MDQVYSEVWAQVPFGVAILSLDGRCLAVNRAFCDWLGMPSAELTHQELTHRIHPIDGLSYRQGLTKLVATDILNCVLELRFLTRDRVVAWGRLTLQLIRDRRGQPNYLVATLENINQRRQLEADLVLEKRYGQLVMAFTRNIRQVKGLQAVLQMAATLAQQQMQADRVVIYRFDPQPNQGGSVVAEAAVPGIPKMLGERLTDPCLTLKQCLGLYQPGYVSAINNIYTEGLAACYVNLLARYEVMANLVLPLEDGDRLWGLLAVQQCHRSRVWSPADITLIQQLVEHIGVALCQGQLYDQLQEDMQQQQAINEISQTILGAARLDQVFNLTLSRILKLVDGDHVGLIQYHRDRQCWLVISEERRHETVISCLGHEIPHADNTIAATIMQRQTFCTDDAYTVHDSVNPAFATRQPGGWLAVPLIVNGEVWGALSVNRGPDSHQGWDQRQRQLTEAIAGQLSLAIQQHRLYRQIQQQAEQQAALNRVLGIIRDSLDLQQVFTNAAQEAVALLQVERMLICEYQAEAELWRVHVDYYPGVEPDRTYVNLEIPDSDNPMMTPLKQGQLLRIDHPETSPIMADEFLATLVRTFPGGWMILPLRVENKVWGKCAFIQKDSWQDWQQDLAINIADKLAIAIQQSVLYQRLQDVNQHLETLAMLDGLTHIPNRRYFDDYLGQSWERARRESQHISLILADVDFFKAFNDTHGHQVGDQCLIAIAEALQRAIHRPGDVVARYGGEEFGVVLPNTPLAGAVRIAEAIQAEINALALHHGSSPLRSTVSLSLGIACTVPQPGDLSTGLLAQADRALYLAKRQGRDRYCIC
jgi:diguanylate cyclase (GGDEF)-like protein/PAS domain S-box-containing protein